MLVSILYIYLGIVVNYLLDENIYHKRQKIFNEEHVENNSLFVLTMNMAQTFGILMIISFLIKSTFDATIAQAINIEKYKGVYELYTGSALVIALVTFSQVLNKQYKDIKVKLSGRIY